MAKDEYRVRFALKGRLFVEIDDFVKEVPNPFDSVPQKVKLVWVDGQPYIKGWEPKPKKKAVKKEDEKEIYRAGTAQINACGDEVDEAGSPLA